MARLGETGKGVLRCPKCRSWMRAHYRDQNGNIYAYCHKHGCEGKKLVGYHPN